ncbi:hypothetical protein HII17_04600 [Thalassotalea sp. M1531]|uniref:DUF1488 domain-containing protein n=1 Tax=Thalassotalea algicola TaxID=2716224 RepID=A0A7Y0LAH0_9GAMM|nr:hypothetical protein [Thalassotalea algicola]NMP30836.1 hypothetical protein [Thalassotalea algicola]
MNQSILFNDDLTLDDKTSCWKMSAIVSGQIISIYFHSLSLSRLEEIDQCTKYDLEEVAELWLEDNELDGEEIHIMMKG